MHRKQILAVLLLLLSVGATPAQVEEYELKAEFVERFTRFIDWPPSSLNDARFVIAVIGKDPFGPHLREIAKERRIKGKEVLVRNVEDPADLAGAHIVFISASEKPNLARILAVTANRPVLTIADSEGFGSSGVLINFYSADDKIRFEINESAVNRSGLRLSSRLLKLARIVDTGGKR